MVVGGRVGSGNKGGEERGFFTAVNGGPWKQDAGTKTIVYTLIS